MQEGYYWAKPDGKHWEVVKVSDYVVSGDLALWVDVTQRPELCLRHVDRLPSEWVWGSASPDRAGGVMSDHRMMKWEIEFRPVASFDVEVEAATEDEAVAKAWEMLKRENPPPEWDLLHVSEAEDDWTDESDPGVPAGFPDTDPDPTTPSDGGHRGD